MHFRRWILRVIFSHFRLKPFGVDDRLIEHFSQIIKNSLAALRVCWVVLSYLGICALSGVRRRTVDEVQQKPDFKTRPRDNRRELGQFSDSLQRFVVILVFIAVKNTKDAIVFIARVWPAAGSVDTHLS